MLPRQGKRKFRVWVSLLAVSAGALFLGAGAGGCADQQEGERCTFFQGGDAGENGTSECASGLACTVTNYYTTDMATTGVGTLGVCCPPSGTPSNVPACMPTLGGSTTGGQPTGDGGYDGTLPEADTKHDATSDSEASTSDAKREGSTASPDATKD